MSGALDGLLVVALEQAVAAPYCTSRLADAGARVIKIERPEGDFARHYDRVVDGESAYFVWLNRGKESLVLNIKDPDDAALLSRILARADVFVQNLAPGAAARAGFGSDDLRARHPRLITCDISGYGEGNAYADMKAYDMLVQAESGLAAITGGPEAPARVGVSVCDIGAGMYAHAAVLEALIGRGVTGKGRGIQVSLFDSLADWMAVPLLHYDYGGKAPGRVGLRHPSIAPYEAFPTADGGLVLISIQNEREWARLAGQVLGHPEWATEGPYRDGVSRAAHREDLHAAIAAEFGKHDRDAMAKKLKAAAIAYGFVNGVEELSVHPVLRRISVETPSGTAAMPAPPALFDDAPPPRPVPAVGAHTEAIRQEFAP
ncbi:MAG: CoA transferase [Rhodobacterales bacterium]|nr:CoA transferase [Rhodobacterales bacterium]